MVEAGKRDGSVFLTEMLEHAAFALDGDGLGLVSTGNVFEIRNAARTPLETATTVGDVTTAVLFFWLPGQKARP